MELIRQVAKNRAAPFYASLILFILLRLPSLFERFWYADEGFYASIGVGMQQGKLLYAQIFDQKPPFIYVVYYIASFLPNWDYSLIAVRLASIGFGIAAIIAISKIAQRLFHASGLIWFAVLFFAFLLGIPFLEANIANAEVFFIAVTTAVFYLLLTKQRYWLIGALAFLGFFIKIQAFFEIVLLISIFLGIDFRETLNPSTIKRTLLPIILGFAIPTGVFIGYLIITGTVSDFIYAGILYNISYVNQSDQINHTLGIPHLGTIIMPIGLVISLSLLFFCYAKRYIPKDALVILALLVIELGATFLSGRAYAHYFIQILPGLTLVTTYLLWQAKRSYRFTYSVTIPMSLIGYYLLAQVIIAHTLFQSYIFPSAYYASFFQTFISHSTTDPFPWRYGYSINRDLAISQKLAHLLGPNQSYYLYTEEPWVFALAGKPFTNKYLAWYQTTTVQNGYAIESRNAQLATFIVVDDRAQFKETFFESLPPLKKIDAVDGFTIYHRE